MTIRPATLDDSAAIKKLVCSLTDFYLEDKTAAIPEWFSDTLTQAAFDRRLSAGDFLSFVYCQNKAIAGYIALQQPSPPQGNCHLYHLFVDQAVQGQGIAKKLWQHCQQQTNAERYTLRSSIYAIPVYKKFGFVEQGPAQSKQGIGFQPMLWQGDRQ